MDSDKKKKAVEKETSLIVKYDKPKNAPPKISSDFEDVII